MSEKPKHSRDVVFNVSSMIEQIRIGMPVGWGEQDFNSSPRRPDPQARFDRPAGDAAR